MPEIPITVLMPAYNVQTYVGNAVESILNQTFPDFELLIIDDGSTDKTPAILSSYNDPRIKIIRQSNQGVASALRLGIERAAGLYIARMDADDESLPKRLETQKKYLDQHPEAVLVYGLHHLMDAQGEILRTGQGAGFPNVLAKWLLLWMNVFTHPTVMFRARTLREHQLNYRLETNGAEDFDLWNRLSLTGEFFFIPEVFIQYRLHAQSVNRMDGGQRQLQGIAAVIGENFSRYGVALPPEGARELAVISGQTQINPLTYPYVYLLNRLHFLQRDLTEKFTFGMRAAPKALGPVQAAQLTRWARYVVQVSKRYAFKLLLEALRRDPTVIRTRVFGLTFLISLVPRSLLSAINRHRTQPLH